MITTTTDPKLHNASGQKTLIPIMGSIEEGAGKIGMQSPDNTECWCWYDTMWVKVGSGPAGISKVKDDTEPRRIVQGV